MKFVSFPERPQWNGCRFNFAKPRWRASVPPADTGFNLAYAPRRQPVRNPLLLPEALDAETLNAVHVSAAVRGRQYLCPFANCLERVRLRAGHNRRMRPAKSS